MKKALFAFTLIVIFITGCTEKQNSTTEVKLLGDENVSVIEIKENMFITQLNDIYMNKNEYLGKTVKLEGLYKQSKGNERDYCFVIRNAPGCCGNDGSAGLEVYWEISGENSPGEEKNNPNPKIDDWVEARGTLKEYEEEGMSYLYIALSDLNVLEKRGAVFVSR